MNASAPIETVPEGDGVKVAVDGYYKMLREKILFGLSIYRELSPTMLQVFLGTSTPSNVWKPILEQLKTERKISETSVTLTSPHERNQSYTVLHLADHVYIKPRVQNEPTEPDEPRADTQEQSI